MNFAEVLVAALLFAGASSGSLQIWAAAVAASRGAELGLEQLVELDGALLAAEQRLQQASQRPDLKLRQQPSVDKESLLKAVLARAKARLQPAPSKLKPR